jgi:hypothetical protein
MSPSKKEEKPRNPETEGKTLVQKLYTSYNLLQYMVSGEQLVAIDIGSSKIKAVIGEWTDDKKLRVLGI